MSDTEKNEKKGKKNKTRKLIKGVTKRLNVQEENICELEDRIMALEEKDSSTHKYLLTYLVPAIVVAVITIAEVRMRQMKGREIE